jgi:serine/threonine protein kinase/Tfp pilus assembly protein PilF
MTLAPGTRLGPYEILARIGAGGMGEVWKARDTRLGRVVAIKKVKEQHSERFKQEARSIAALNHPNICQLFDIGEDYLVLEYVEGKPLSCPLSEREAVRLAIQIATALEEAHAKGIIHRDLKPSNIMVTDKGSVKLLDFGLAKLYEQDASSSQSPTVDFPATQAGAILGTVAYMSPEQAQGQSADARSDIFSFGLVLYEMLCGRRAFTGDSNYSVMDAIVKKDPPPLQASPAFVSIVSRCLAKQPSARYQAIAEVRTALEAVSREMEAESSTEPQPSIAVLPFINMSGDKEQEYFSDGLSEEIINALTQIPGLKVIARTSSFSFRGKETDIAQIRDRLRVQNILEGSVRKSGNRIRVTAQLINTADESHLWSERYDRDMTDVFAIQDEISQAIAEKLRVRLSGERGMERLRTEKPEAYNLYLKGRYFFVRLVPESISKCKEYYEQATILDPFYALPWFGLALYYWYLGYEGSLAAKEANAMAREAVLKALELDETLAEAHSFMGVHKTIEFDWNGANLEFQRALELCPRHWDVLYHYSQYGLLPMGRQDEAIAMMQRALETDPLSPILHVMLAYVYMYARKYGRAIEQLHIALELDPYFGLAHQHYSRVLSMTGKYSESIRAGEACVQIMGRGPIYLSALGYAYGRAGQSDEAQRILEELRDLSRNSYAPALSLAEVHLGLGEMDKCLDWLERAVEERESVACLIHVDPTYDPLRTHSRYRALLRKMNLEAGCP